MGNRAAEVSSSHLLFFLIANFFPSLQARVDKLGVLMGQVVKKVNSVLVKLDAIDSKNENKEERPTGSAGSRSLTSAKGLVNFNLFKEFLKISVFSSGERSEIEENANDQSEDVTPPDQEM